MAEASCVRPRPRRCELARRGAAASRLYLSVMPHRITATSKSDMALLQQFTGEKGAESNREW